MCQFLFLLVLNHCNVAACNWWCLLWLRNIVRWLAALLKKKNGPFWRPHKLTHQFDDSGFPVALLSQELVDLVVEIPNAKLSEAGVLNLRNLLRDLSNDLKQEKDQTFWYLSFLPAFSFHWSFSLSFLGRLASQLGLGTQAGSTTDHSSNCFLSNTPKILNRGGLCLLK